MTINNIAVYTSTVLLADAPVVVGVLLQIGPLLQVEGVLAQPSAIHGVLIILRIAGFLLPAAELVQLLPPGLKTLFQGLVAVHIALPYGVLQLLAGDVDGDVLGLVDPQHFSPEIVNFAVVLSDDVCELF